VAEYRTMRVSFWDDPYIESLTPLEKLLYIYLFSNPHVNNLGIMDISQKKISFETGLTLDAVSDGIAKISGDKKLLVDGTTIFLCNFVKHQTTTSPKLVLSLKNQFKFVSSPVIKHEICLRYPHIFDAPDTVSMPSDTVSIPSGELERELEREDYKKKPPYPPSGGETAGPSLPISPEENPDNLPGAEISDLSECLIEFQDIAAVFQEAGGNVDTVPAYSAFLPMRYNFPKDRVVDDIATRGQSDAWRRMDVPMNLSTYLSKKKWLDPIPKPREKTRASPQPRTFRDQRQMESEQTAKRLKAEMGILNASVDAATGQVSHGFVQHAALGGGAEES